MGVESTEYENKQNARIISNVRSLCLRANMTVAQLENALGFGNGSISKWKTAKRPAPAERVEAIAQFFKIPLSEITGSKIGHLVSLVPPQIASDSVSFPVIGGVAAGFDRIAYEDWTGDSIEIPRSYLHGHEPQEFFALRVKGDSMYPDFRDADHVLVFRQDTMDHSGQIGVVIYGDDCGTLKRVEYAAGEDWMVLRPINPQFPPITIRGEELEHCKVLGIAKMVIRELDQ